MDKNKQEYAAPQIQELDFGGVVVVANDSGEYVNPINDEEGG